MDTFLNTYILPNFNQEKIENLHISIMSSETKSETKHLPSRKLQEPKDQFSVLPHI
jgi:hypothetical protein